MAPVVTVFPTDDPETMPHRAEEMTATFAGPPLERPAILFAKAMKKPAMPVRSRNAPKMMNRTMYVKQTLTGVPMTPEGE